MSVTAVIVNYYTAAILPPLLDDLWGDPLVGKVIIVDNSKELNAEIVSKYENIHVLKNAENRGFGAAVNQAVAYAEGEWIFVINPDIRLCEGCLAALVCAGEKYGCALLGPRFYWDDHFQFRLPPATGDCLWLDAAQDAAEKFELDRELFSFYWILRHQRFWEAEVPFFEPFLTGACLLIGKEWIQSQGCNVFDERFFLYFEDTDLCARAMKDGIRPLCVPQAMVIHYWDQSPSPEKSKSDLMIRAHEDFVKKYYGGLLYALPGGNKDEPPGIFDLGELARPPEFFMDVDAKEESLFFEIGLNPWFVPFAQASLETNKFAFPSNIWSRLGQGIYYGRVRGTRSGTKTIWKWKKK